MNRVLLLLQDLYQAKCFLSKLFIRYVQCADLDKKLSVSELAITIRLGHSRVNRKRDVLTCQNDFSNPLVFGIKYIKDIYHELKLHRFKQN